jgi:hypothetical protein
MRRLTSLGWLDWGKQLSQLSFFSILWYTSCFSYYCIYAFHKLFCKNIIDGNELTGSIPSELSCNIGSQISCSVTRPAGVFTCETLTAPVAETCPNGVELLRAYLIYDGSAGPSAFLEITCDKSKYVAEVVQAGQVVELNMSGNAVCEEAIVTIYNSDPLKGGSEVESSALQIACPGPWTLGAKIAPGFVLESYVSSTDNGITFDYNTLSVELEIIFIGYNLGSDPVTISSGEIVSPFGKGPIIGLPTNIAVKNQQIIQIQVENIQLSGQRGKILSFSQVLDGVFNNKIGLPCEDYSELVINL